MHDSFIKRTTLIAALVLGFGCSGEEGAPPQRVWSDVFRNRTEVSPPSLVDSTGEALVLGTLYGIDVHGTTLFVSDPANHRVLIVPEDGPVHTVGAPGGGPGEIHILAGMTVDETGALYVFDVNGYRISRFVKSPQGYVFDSAFSVDASLLEIHVANGSLYGLAENASSILRKYDLDGTLVTEAGTPSGSRYQQYASRFDLGGLSVRPETRLSVVYPGRKPIVVYDSTLTPIDTLAVHGDAPLPPIRSLPESLSPYGRTDAHDTWWAEGLHTVDIMTLDAEHSAVLSIDGAGEIDDWHLHVYRHDTGRPVATVTVPADERILGAHDGRLYTSRPPRFSDGRERPPNLFRYTLHL